MLGVETETPGNVVLILPKAAAQRLVEARDETGRVAAVLQAAAYLNGVPISFWPLHNREYLVLLRPGRFRLLLHTLFYADEVRALDEFRTEVEWVSPRSWNWPVCW
ncbi:MAG: hypothetical protein WCB12_20890 [Bryobacteraceae bacterium]